MATAGLALAILDFFDWLKAVEHAVQRAFRKTVAACPSMGSYFSFPFRLLFGGDEWSSRGMRLLSWTAIIIAFLFVTGFLASLIEPWVLWQNPNLPLDEARYASRMYAFVLFPVSLVVILIGTLGIGLTLLILMAPFYLLQRALHFLAARPRGLTGALGLTLAAAGFAIEFLR